VRAHENAPLVRAAIASSVRPSHKTFVGAVAIA
jgi:hypothetical protein